MKTNIPTGESGCIYEWGTNGSLQIINQIFRITRKFFYVLVIIGLTSLLVFTGLDSVAAADDDQGESLDFCGPNICIFSTDGETTTINLGPDYQIDQSPEFSWSPDGNYIVFPACHIDDLQGNGECFPDLYITDREGNISELIRNPGDFMYLPTWSPDGEWIAYHVNGSLNIVRYDRSEIRVLKPGGPAGSTMPNFIAWSPDSRRLAFVGANEEGVSEKLWVVNVDGSGMAEIYDPEGMNLSTGRATTWSPDGEYVLVVNELGVVFQIDPDCNDLPAGCDDNSRSTVAELPEQWLPTFFPQWGMQSSSSVDFGSVYGSSLEEYDSISDVPKDEIVGASVDYCDTGICINHTDGSTEIINVGSDLVLHSAPELTWSPDGQQIIFSACQIDDLRGDNECVPDLYLIDFQGNVSAFIRNPSDHLTLPTWSPDGEWIAYQVNGALNIVRSDRTEVVTLKPGGPEGGTTPSFIAWSPDSMRLAWTGADEDSVVERLWVINVDGSGMTMIYKPEDMTLSTGRAVAWSPDGTKIMVADQLGAVYAIDADCVATSAGCDESSRTRIAEIPEHWLPTFYPQWVGESIEP